MQPAVQLAAQLALQLAVQLAVQLAAQLAAQLAGHRFKGGWNLDALENLTIRMNLKSL